MVFLEYARSVVSEFLSFSPAAYPIRGARETSREGTFLGWELVIWGKNIDTVQKGRRMSLWF